MPARAMWSPQAVNEWNVDCVEARCSMAKILH